jgi:hypothetical protein
MSIGIVDTSIFCEILQVPTKSQHREIVTAQLIDHINHGVTLLLPMATILETGNHVAQNGNGNLRRRTASRFVEQVQKALNGEAAWTISRPLFQPDDLREYLAQFPDSAMRGTGLGDLSIIKEFEFQCKMNPGRRIFIWSLDHHLHGHDRPGS